FQAGDGIRDPLATGVQTCALPILLRDLCRDMSDVCPDATLLNYANPMSMNMQTISRTHPGLRAVGLCHSVQGTLCQLMGYLGEEDRKSVVEGKPEAAGARRTRKDA